VKRLLGILDTFWFVEGSATRLAMLRIVVGAASLAYFAPRFNYFSQIAASSPEVFEPVGLARLLDAPIPVRLFQVIMACMLLANVAFLLGWRFQRTGPLFAALLLWVLCYRNSWSMIYHTDNLIVLQALILGLTRSADALSLDARGQRPVTGEQCRSVREARAGAPGERGGWHWEYGYPIMLICAVTAVTYVLSGIAKVSGPLSWGWALGDGLRNQVGFDGLRKELISDGAAPLAFVLFNNLPLATVMGVGTLVLELGAPLALLSAWSRRLWAIGTFLMHWGIFAIMGITFWYHMSGLAFVPFLLDERVVAWCRTGIAQCRRVLGTSALPRATASRQGAPVSAAVMTQGRAVPDSG
jgi:hypothetical protein